MSSGLPLLSIGTSSNKPRLERRKNPHRYRKKKTYWDDKLVLKQLFRTYHRYKYSNNCKLSNKNSIIYGIAIIPTKGNPLIFKVWLIHSTGTFMDNLYFVELVATCYLVVTYSSMALSLLSDRPTRSYTRSFRLSPNRSGLLSNTPHM